MVSWPGNIAWVSVVFVAILISECIIMKKIDVKFVDEMMVTVCVCVFVCASVFCHMAQNKTVLAG